MISSLPRLFDPLSDKPDGPGSDPRCHGATVLTPYTRVMSMYGLPS